MNIQQWVGQVQKFTEEIEAKYPKSTNHEREEWRKRLKQIQKTCADVLHSWAVVEDEIAKMTKQYPQLFHDEEQIEDEFFLDHSMVRQFREGQGYYNLTMFQKATSLFDQIVQKEPDFLLGRIYLGLCYFQEGKTEESKYHFRLIIRTASSDEFVGLAHHLLGCVYIQEGENQVACKQFTEAVSILPKNGDAWFNLATCHYRLKQYQEAIPYFFQALSIDPDDWEAMYYLADCYAHCNQSESARFWRISAYEKVKHPQVMQSIAQDYEESQMYQKALHWYQRLYGVDRKSHIAYYGLAWNYWMIKEKEKSMGWLKKGLTLYPKDPHLLSFHFWMLLQERKVEKARKVLKILPSEMATDPVWLALQSRLFAQIGDYRYANFVADQLINQSEPSISALGYYQKGKIFLEIGEIEEALQNFQKSHHHLQNWQDPLFYEGICHLMQEEPEQTKACWEKINFYS